MPGNSGIKK